MTDEESLIAGVLLARGDDLPRLVYADWLDERGQHERAAFIRDHCALATLPEWLPSTCKTCDATADTEGWFHHGWQCYRPSLHDSPHDRADRNPDWVAALERIRTRLGFRTHLGWGRNSSVLTNWTADVIPGQWKHPNGEYWYSLGFYTPAWVGNRRDGTAVWSRGFIDELALPADVWVRHGDTVCAAHPVRRVELTTDPAIRHSESIADNWSTLVGDPLGKTFPFLATAEAGRQAAPNTLPGYRHRLALLCSRWPGVEFKLPSAPNTPVQALWRGMTGRDEVPLYGSASEVLSAAQQTVEIIRVAQNTGLITTEEATRMISQLPSLRPNRQPDWPDNR